MSDEQLREFGIKYLIDSGFVDALSKKLMFPSDINDLYEDYRNECYLAILELPDNKWRILYDSSIKKGKSFEYEIRNFVSVIVRNTVRSTSSQAYKRLKKNSVYEQGVDDNTWKIMEYSIPDDAVDFGSKVPKRNNKDDD